MDLQALFHWIYMIAMAIGAVYFISLGNNPRGVPSQGLGISCLLVLSTALLL